METVREALRDGVGLRLDEGACLPLRSRHGRCSLCASACPKRVLDVSVDSVRLAADCIECGRCVAACPTDALALDGFEPAAGIPATAHRIEVECSRVPQQALSASAVQVPCLGALSVGRILELNERLPDGGLVLVDRGGCGECEAGCAGEHPAGAAIDRARLWLEAVGSPEPALPRVELRPLPAARLARAIPRRDAQAQALTRREFFRAAVERSAGRDRLATPMGSSGRAAFPASARRPSRERLRQLAALDAAARRRNTRVPPEFFAEVRVAGACADHRVCSAICPTGALKAEPAGEVVALTFAGEACIGCEACLRACPEGALVLETHGGQRERVELVQHRPATCRECGDAFTPRAQDEKLCMSCQKSQRFMRDGVDKLFRVPR